MTYDCDLCILFFYHKCDELTRFHLERLRQFNSAALILPVTDSVPDLLPGSVDVARLPPFCVDSEKWRGIDATLYRWFNNRTFNAQRYLLAEYDCLCNVSLRDYYAEVWDADVAGVDFFTRENNPRWRWFKNDELSKVPQEDRMYAAAIVPFTCTMFSHAALERIVANVYRQDIFSELRLGTTVNKLGLEFRRLPRAKRGTICWHEYPWQTTRPGFFHSVKSLGHNSGRHEQPGDVFARGYDFLRSSMQDRELLPFFLRGKRQGLKRRLGWPT
jgi:hypothetical protein